MSFQGVARADIAVFAIAWPFEAGILVQVEPALDGEALVTAAKVVYVWCRVSVEVECLGDLRDQELVPFFLAVGVGEVPRVPEPKIDVQVRPCGKCHLAKVQHVLQVFFGVCGF